MAIIQRRNRAADAPGGEHRPHNLEPGIKVTCDLCHSEITNTVRFKCADAECGNLDICPNCFCEGKEGLRHKAWHDYSVEEEMSMPIFTEDWGADEELLLMSGLITNGLGNWAEVAGTVGTRTKEECERHYVEAYLDVKPGSGSALDPIAGDGAAGADSKNGDMDINGEERKRKREFMPPMHARFDIDPEEFSRRKKARIEEMRKPQALPAPSGPLVSAPTNHEVGGFMPGRLEFEHEVDNDAEMAVKDMEFGLVWKYGGDEQPEAKPTEAPGEVDDDDNDDDDDDENEDGVAGGDAAAVEDKKPQIGDADQVGSTVSSEAGPSNSMDQKGAKDSKKKSQSSKSKGKAKAEEPTTAEVEDEDELEIKLALLDIYMSKLDKREEAKDLIFDRGLTEFKKIQANERKRAKDDKELVQRYKVFAKLQTAEDFEVLIEGLMFEQSLRRRIAELQEYRRMGITTASEAEAYDAAKLSRQGYRAVTAPRERERLEPIVFGARANAGQHRFLHGAAGTPPSATDKYSRDLTPKSNGTAGRKPSAPLNLANAQSLDLLTLDEQSLCSQLRIMPKPYLSIKETYIRENERRMGKLRRRDARKMLKIDVNKSGRIFDFLVTTGFLRLAYDPLGKQGAPTANGVKDINASPNGVAQRPELAEVHLSNGVTGINGVR